MEIINIGNLPNDHTGDTLRGAMIKIIANFDDLSYQISTLVTDTEFTTEIDSIRTSLNTLNSALNNKSDVGHTHVISQILGLQQALDLKTNLSTFNFQTNQFNIQLAGLNQQIIEILDLINGGGVGVTDHEELDNLQGGDANLHEHYHLTKSQHERVLAQIYINSTYTFTISPTTGERGLVTNINGTYNINSFDDQIIGATVSGIGSVLSNVNLGTQSQSLGTSVNNSSYSLSLTYVRNGATASDSISRSYTSYLPQFSGVSALSDLDVSSYSIISGALTKVVQAGTTISRSLQPSSQYVYFISTNANATITNNGFPVTIGAWGSSTDFFNKKNISLVLADGTSVGSLTIYRTYNTVTLSAAQNFTIS